MHKLGAVLILVTYYKARMYVYLHGGQESMTHFSSNFSKTVKDTKQQLLHLSPHRDRGVWTSPSGFSQKVEKRQRGAPLFLGQLLIHLSRRLCENFGPRSLMVRSPVQVKWPHLRKTLNVRHGYTEWLITLKLSAINIPNSIYKMYISEIWYLWPKVRPILRPLRCK